LCLFFGGWGDKIIESSLRKKCLCRVLTPSFYILNYENGEVLIFLSFGPVSIVVWLCPYAQSYCMVWGWCNLGYNAIILFNKILDLDHGCYWIHCTWIMLFNCMIYNCYCPYSNFSETRKPFSLLCSLFSRC